MEVEGLGEELGLAFGVHIGRLDRDLVDSYHAVRDSRAIYDKRVPNLVVARKNVRLSHPKLHIGLVTEKVDVLIEAVLELITLHNVQILQIAHPVWHDVENVDTW